MFDLFDKVMVLNEGQCIYFGPTSKALAHFQGWTALKAPL
jgi:ABC-type multidrug transport system ATPase subunit